MKASDVCLFAPDPPAAPTVAELAERADMAAHLAELVLDSVKGLARAPEADAGGVIVRRLAEAIESLEWALRVARLAEIVELATSRPRPLVWIPDPGPMTFIAIARPDDGS